jgi:hypothetical protein
MNRASLDAIASKLLHRKYRQDQYGVRRRAGALRMQTEALKVAAETLNPAMSCLTLARP